MAATFTIKEEKKLSRQDIHFSLARVPGTSASGLRYDFVDYERNG